MKYKALYSDITHKMSNITNNDKINISIYNNSEYFDKEYEKIKTRILHLIDQQNTLIEKRVFIKDFLQYIKNNNIKFIQHRITFQTGVIKIDNSIERIYDIISLLKDQLTLTNLDIDHTNDKINCINQFIPPDNFEGYLNNIIEKEYTFQISAEIKIEKSIEEVISRRDEIINEILDSINENNYNVILEDIANYLFEYEKTIELTMIENGFPVFYDIVTKILAYSSLFSTLNKKQIQATYVHKSHYELNEYIADHVKINTICKGFCIYLIHSGLTKKQFDLNNDNKLPLFEKYLNLALNKYNKDFKDELFYNADQNDSVFLNFHINEERKNNLDYQKYSDTNIQIIEISNEYIDWLEKSIKPVKYFKNNYKQSEIEFIYSQLNNKYIECTLADFKTLFSKSPKKIKWINKKNFLAFFVYDLFQKNNKDFWSIAESIFIDDNTNPYSSLRQSYNHTFSNNKTREPINYSSLKTIYNHLL